MRRYLPVLIGLLVRVSTAQAQPAVASNTIKPADGLITTGTVPSNIKATETSFYIKVYGFYSLLMPGTEINYDLSQTQVISPNSFNATNTKLGAGLRAGIGIGFIVSDFINVGVDADLLLGTPIKTNTNVYSGSSSAYSHVITSSTTTPNVLSVIPNVTFKALSRPTYYIYNRLGLILGTVLDYKTVVQSAITSSKGVVTTNDYTSSATKNSLAIGYQAALGIQFRLSQAIRAFAEIVAYNQSFKPREIQTTGTSVTSGQTGKTTPINTTTSYKDQGDYANPNEYPTINVAINSVGVGAGVGTPVLTKGQSALKFTLMANCEL